MSDVPRALLRACFDAAVARADATRCLPAHLPAPPAGRTVVVGAGKAAAAMAHVVDAHWPAQAPLTGLVVTRYGHGMPASQAGRIEVVEAAHPMPDHAGQQAAQRMLAAVAGLTADDLVLALMSGGASALLASPLPPLTLEEKRAVTGALLNSGADIRDMNCVRKHLSAIKGGRLARAASPAAVLTLAISDVPGDDLSAIGSGPTVGDPTTCADALAICARHGIALPPAAQGLLASGEAETPKPGDAALARAGAVIVATAQASLEAAADLARRHGITPLILGDRIEGEAREVARAMAGIALACREHGTPARPPCLLLSGGETTVTVRGTGRGGRNAEFLLALVLALGGAPGIHAMACDTDGIDGVEDNAGALAGPQSLSRLRALGYAPRRLLDDNDAHRAFAALGDLVVTGPTRTNVNDFRAILVT